MYLEYLKEREGLEEIKNENGFIHYRFFIGQNGEKCCFISSCFIISEKRKKGKCKELVDKLIKICKKNNIKYVYCQSDIRSRGHNNACVAILGLGFEIYKTEGPGIHYVMEVAKWEEL